MLYKPKTHFTLLHILFNFYRLHFPSLVFTFLNFVLKMCALTLKVNITPSGSFAQSVMDPFKRSISRCLLFVFWLSISDIDQPCLTLQRRRTFKFLRSPRTEEFKFPTSSAPVCIRGIDLRFLTCRWMPYVV